MPLSDPKIRNIRPKARAYKLADGGGLYLLVTPSGSKYWRLKYRYGGKERLLALGVYPDVRLPEAREKRDHAKRLLREDRDPSNVRKERKRAAEKATSTTFAGIADEWIDQRRNQWSSDHATRVADSLKTEIYAELGARPINEISARELLAVLRKIEGRGALETAQRVLQRCDAVFRYAVVTGRCDRSPAGDLRGALKSPKRKNRPALAAADLPEFLQKLEAYDGQTLTKLAIKLLLLTFVRPGELRFARWQEFDLARAEWRIPAERMKMRAEHLVPLSRQSIAVLEQLQPVSGRSPFVFPNQSKPHAPMSENTILYAIYRMGYHSRATGHGFRATASTILNETGKWNRDAIERQLAHAERDKIRAAYHRAEYIDERRKMMQAWADFLDAVAAGGKVIPMRKAS